MIWCILNGATLFIEGSVVDHQPTHLVNSWNPSESWNLCCLRNYDFLQIIHCRDNQKQLYPWHVKDVFQRKFWENRRRILHTCIFNCADDTPPPLLLDTVWFLAVVIIVWGTFSSAGYLLWLALIPWWLIYTISYNNKKLRYDAKNFVGCHSHLSH